MLLTTENTFLPMDNSDSESETSDVSMTSVDTSSDGEDMAMNDQAAASSSLNNDEEEEEDDLIKAINAAKELTREHPPAITVDHYVVGVSFHPVEDMIALADAEGDVHFYGYNNNETILKSTIPVHENACRDIKFSADGDTIFTIGSDKSIMLTDTKTEKLKGLYENAHDVPIYTLTIISEHTFATGDDDGTVKIWDLRQRSTQKPVFSLKTTEPGAESNISSMLTNEDRKYLVCASADGSLTTINLSARKMHCQSVKYDEEFTCLGLFKENTKILAASNTGKMYIFNWGEFGLHSDEYPNLTKKSINCIIPITDNVVITGGEDGILRAYSLFPHKRLGIAGQHSSSVEYLDICNDGTLIASSAHDNIVKFWNIKYFESFNVENTVQGGKQKQMKHNLPSSKVNNASDFFADM